MDEDLLDALAAATVPFETFLACAVLEGIISQREADLLMQATDHGQAEGYTLPAELLPAMGRLMEMEMQFPPLLH